MFYPPMHPDVWVIHTKPYEAFMAIWYGSSGMAQLTQLLLSANVVVD